MPIVQAHIALAPPLSSATTDGRPLPTPMLATIQGRESKILTLRLSLRAFWCDTRSPDVCEDQTELRPVLLGLLYCPFNIFRIRGGARTFVAVLPSGTFLMTGLH